MAKLYIQYCLWGKIWRVTCGLLRLSTASIFTKGGWTRVHGSFVGIHFNLSVCTVLASRPGCRVEKRLPIMRPGLEASTVHVCTYFLYWCVLCVNSCLCVSFLCSVVCGHVIFSVLSSHVSYVISMLNRYLLPHFCQESEFFECVGKSVWLCFSKNSCSHLN